MIFKLFSFLLFFSHTTFANEILKRCEQTHETFSIECLGYLPPLPISIDNKAVQVFSKWAWIKEKLEESSLILDAEIDDGKYLLRYFRDDFVESDQSRVWFEQEYKNIKNDYFDLRVVVAQINVLIFQINNCHKFCSAYTRVEKEKELERLNALKLTLLVRRPILAAPELEESISKNEALDDKVLKKKLASSYSLYLSNLDEQRQNANKILGRENAQYDFLMAARSPGQAIKQEHFIDLLEKKDFVDNDFMANLLNQINWFEEVSDPVFKGVACQFYKENLNYLKLKSAKDIGSDVAMFVAPFAIGPISRLGIWGLRGAGLLRWGIRAEGAQKVIQSGQAVLSGFYFLNSIDEIQEKREECNQILGKFIQNKHKDDFRDYKTCHNDVDNKMTFAIVESSIMSFDSIRRIKGTLAFFRNYNQKTNIYEVRTMDELQYQLGRRPLNGQNYEESGFVFRSEKDGNYYALNLAHSQNVHGLRFLGDDYWNFVSDIYSRRLNLSQAEITDFVKSSKEMAPRTTLIVNTAGKKSADFKGGVAVVTSKNATEKMPLEKATGLEIKREKGKRVAEIVRLTVDEKLSDKELVDRLIGSVLSTVQGEKDISKLYVYTSKIHARLYKKFGIPLKEIHKTSRDVVLEIDVDSLPF